MKAHGTEETGSVREPVITKFSESNTVKKEQQEARDDLRCALVQIKLQHETTT